MCTIRFHCRNGQRISETVPGKSFRAKGDFCHFSQSFKPIFCSWLWLGLLLVQRCSRWDMGRLQFATVSPMTACRTFKPAASLTCSTYLAACLLLTPCQDASWLLKPWCLPICLFALKCLRSAAAETIGQFYHLPLSPISTVVIIFTNHLPEALVPVISFKLSRDDYGGICFSRLLFQM